MLPANDYRYRLHGPSRESNRTAKNGNREVAAFMRTINYASGLLT